MYSLNDIRGNEKLIKLFKSAKKENRILNSYIIEGNSGSGKMFIAKCIAKYLQCYEGTIDSCGNCNSCKSFDAKTNPDIIYVDKERDRTEFTVNVVRERIVTDVYIKPFSHKYKIYIIDNADKMNIQSQNAFLKTLEEPPEYAVFLLLAENSGVFLPTVLSRCTILKTDRIAPKIIRDYLVENNICERNKAEAVSNYSENSIGKAVRIANDEKFNLIRNDVYTIFLNVSVSEEKNMRGIEDIYSAIKYLETNKENIYNILDIAVLFYRDALIYKCVGNDSFTVNKDKDYETHKLADMLTIEKLTDCILYVAKARKNLLARANFVQCMEVMFFGIKERKK